MNMVQPAGQTDPTNVYSRLYIDRQTERQSLVLNSYQRQIAKTYVRFAFSSLLHLFFKTSQSVIDTVKHIPDIH